MTGALSANLDSGWVRGGGGGGGGGGSGGGGGGRRMRPFISLEVMIVGRGGRQPLSPPDADVRRQHLNEISSESKFAVSRDYHKTMLFTQNHLSQL